MKSKSRKVLLYISAVVMIVFSVVVGNNKAGEENKNETRLTKANAAEVESDFDVYEAGEDGVNVYGEMDYSDDINSDNDKVEEDVNVSEDESEEVKSITDQTLNMASESDEISEKISEMSLRDKVAQLFIITPDALTQVDEVTMAGDSTKEAINNYPVGGIIYMGDNLQSKTQVQEMLSNTYAYGMERNGLPMFLCVDEEGGTVARIAGSGRFEVDRVGNMADVGAAGNTQKAREVGETIGEYLAELGFNVDFAPVADVLTNPDNSIVKYRSFGDDADTVSDMSLEVSEGLKSKGLESVFKHFPGHGATAGDTHLGAAFTNKSISELSASELVPFQNAIDNGADFIMVSHISAPGITGHDTPASVSDILITDLLRGQMGYNGIVVTDAMDMGAITQKYSSREAAVLAIQAGVDIILMPENFREAYDGVISAVESGKISEDRIDESLRRILEVKMEME